MAHEPFSRNQVQRLHAVARRIDVGIGGLHVFIDDNPAGNADLETRIFRKLRVGTDADGDHRELAGQLDAVLQLDPASFPFSPRNSAIPLSVMTLAFCSVHGFRPASPTPSRGK